MQKVENKFAKRLKEIREENQVSQAELADELLCKQSTIAKWESGEREPSLDIILAICIYFEVSSDFLLGLKDF